MKVFEDLKFALLIIFLCISPSFLHAEYDGKLFSTELHQDTTFAEVPTSMVNLGHGTAIWGDYDNDGDLDVLTTGIGGRGSSNRDDPSPHISKIYRNDDGTFEDIDAPLVGVNNNDGTIWCDYDNDGDLDLFIGGATREPNADPISKIYRNDDGTFIDISASLPGVVGTASWGDYDNDADLDILVGGSSDNGSTFITKLYRNDNSSFVEIHTVLPGVWAASFAWGDYDNDRDPDLLMIGYGTYGVTSKLFRNDGPSLLSDTEWVFTDVGAPLAQVNSGSVAWGDYDNDGDLDVLLTGYLIGGTGGYATIYRNDGDDKFVDVHPGLIGVGSDPTAAKEYERYMKSNYRSVYLGLIGVGNCAAGWWDYDNDGDPDVILSGQTSTGELVTKIYRNDDGSFVDIDAQIIGVWYSALAWGDYDNDGDLDLIVTGFSKADGTWPYKPLTKLYRNNGSINNTVSTVPADLTAAIVGSSVTLQWNKSSDNQTPQQMLTYNIQIGTTPAGSQRVSAMSDVITGYRRVPRSGNTNHDTSWTITNLSPGTYYWSVQAIDNVYAGSTFAPEQSFTITSVDVSNILELPETFTLYQNYPNPFNPSTVISYGLPFRGRVKLVIFNVLGQQVALLVDGFQPAGYYSQSWTGDVATGVYFYKLEATRENTPLKTFVEIRKMVILR